MPARNSAGIKVSVIKPKRMSGIDGGIRMPIEPDVAKAPTAYLAE